MNAQTFSMKMVSFANMHGCLGLESSVCGFSPDAAWLSPCLTNFFSITWLLASLFSPREEEKGEGETNEEEGEGSTSVSTGCLFDC